MAARSAASVTSAGSVPPSRESKKATPGVIGRWWGRSFIVVTLRRAQEEAASALRIRWSLTGYAVPSCWANSETR